MSFDYISDIYQSYYDSTKSFPLAINAYLNWLEHRKTDLLSITSEEYQGKLISLLTFPSTSPSSELVAISGTVLLDAMDKDTDSTVPVADAVNGSPISMEKDEVVDAYIRAIESITAEIELCKMISADPGSPVDFQKYISAVRSLLPSVSTNVLENARPFIESATSGIECFQLWIRQQQASVEKLEQNGGPTAFDATDYSGSSLMAAVTQIGSTISQFWSNLKFDITKLGEFFKGVIDGVINFATWVLSQAAPGIFTSVQVTSSSPIGIVDYPVLQFALGGINVNSNGEVNDPSELEDRWLEARDILVNDRLTRTSLSDSEEYSSYEYSPLAPSGACCSVSWVLNSYTSWLQKYITKVGDFLDIPLSKGAIRISLLSKEVCGDLVPWNDATLMMQLFVSIDVDSLDNQKSDDVAVVRTYDAVKAIIQSLSTLPIWYQDANFINSYDAIAQTVIRNDLDSPLYNGKWISSLTFPHVYDITFYLNAQVPLASFILVGLMNYCCLSWRTEIRDSNSLSQFLTNANFATYAKTEVPSSISGLYTGAPVSDGLRTGWDQSNCFFPYYHNCMVPTNIHIQTTAEQGEEVVTLLIKVLVAAAAVAAAIAVKKIRRSINVKNSAAQIAAQDALRSYNAGNISAAAASKAVRKASRINRIAKLIGVASTSIVSPLDDTVTEVFGLSSQSIQDGQQHFSDLQQDLSSITQLIR